MFLIRLVTQSALRIYNHDAGLSMGHKPNGLVSGLKMGVPGLDAQAAVFGLACAPPPHLPCLTFWNVITTVQLLLPCHLHSLLPYLICMCC